MLCSSFTAGPVRVKPRNRRSFLLCEFHLPARAGKFAGIKVLSAITGGFPPAAR